MSLERIEGSFGDDKSFVVKPISSWTLVAIVGVIGVGFLGLGTTDRAEQKGVVWLAFGLGGFLLALALFGAWRLKSQGESEVAVIKAMHYLGPHTGKKEKLKLPFAEVTGLVRHVDRHQYLLMYERDGKNLILLGPWQLIDEPSFIELFESRRAIVSAGADSRSEVGAAEAHRDARERGLVCQGIAVAREGKQRTYWSAEDEDGIRSALEKGFEVFVPERTHALLSQSIDTRLRKLRGV
jgi:hypothetical protein